MCIRDSLQHLVDVPGDDAVVIPLLREVRIIEMCIRDREVTYDKTVHVIFHADDVLRSVGFPGNQVGSA